MSRIRGVRFVTGSGEESANIVSPNVSLGLAVGGVAGYAMFKDPTLKNFSLAAALGGMALYTKSYFGANKRGGSAPQLV